MRVLIGAVLVLLLALCIFPAIVQPHAVKADGCPPVPGPNPSCDPIPPDCLSCHGIIWKQ